MPKRWKVLRFGALGAICGLIYWAYVNLALLPYAFESFDMTAYLSSSLIRSTVTGKHRYGDSHLCGNRHHPQFGNSVSDTPSAQVILSVSALRFLRISVDIHR